MSDDEEDYITFGKPLKELEEGEKIRKRPIAVEEQIALDKHGKRRFHGAFQGGFSAGFFNTVDTPQGWTPAQFKSSRDKNRGADKDIAATTADGGDSRMDQRPEDFMDDEDFGSFGFAPQALKTKSRFQNNSSQEVTRFVQYFHA
jgi:G patch domain-containing protein 1